MRAILSDIHGNSEALASVLIDIDKQGARSIYNFGDTLGYGPNPIECLDAAVEINVNLVGNFDHAVLFGAEHFCESARKSINWSRAALDAERDLTARRRRATFLSNLPKSHREDDILFVHGSPRNPVNEYVFPEDIYNYRSQDLCGARAGKLSRRSPP